MENFYLSDRGLVRDTNEDSLLVLGVGSEFSSFSCSRWLFLLADGMGGHRAGETASSCAVRRFAESIIPFFVSPGEPLWREAIHSAVDSANKEVFNLSRSRPDLSGMGTTLVAALFSHGMLHVASVGDSRLYVINSLDRTMRQVTIDHSVVQEHLYYGRISREEARCHPQSGLLTRAIGVSTVVEEDYFELPIEPFETVMLCTDGLTEAVEDGEILQILLDEQDLKRACRRLVDAANDAGGPDNVSVILFRP